MLLLLLSNLTHIIWMNLHTYKHIRIHSMLLTKLKYSPTITIPFKKSILWNVFVNCHTYIRVWTSPNNPCDPIQPPKAILHPVSSAKWAKIRKAGQPESATSPNGTCNNSNLTVAKRRKFPYININILIYIYIYVFFIHRHVMFLIL